MSRNYIRLNRFGFAEYDDMIEIARSIDVAGLVGVLTALIESVFAEESCLLDSLTDGAQADFVVPLGMCAKMLSSGGYSAVELVSAACTVNYCAEPHMSEFPGQLVERLSCLPR